MNPDRLCNKVLVADDDKIIRGYILGLLRTILGPDVRLFEAHDGVSALAQIEEHDIAIVLTDMMMPRMDGLQLIEATRKKYPHVQFVVLSNYDDFAFVRKSFLFGIVNYVIKYQVDAQLIQTLMEEARAALHIHFRQKAFQRELHRADAVEACIARGQALQDALEAYRTPELFQDWAKKPLLNVRVDCLEMQPHQPASRRMLAEDWAVLFDEETGGEFLPSVLPDVTGAGNLRLHLIAHSALHNSAAFLLRVQELIRAFLDRAQFEYHCICLAAMDNSTGFDPLVTGRLSATAELVYYRTQSELLQQPRLLSELLPQNDAHAQFLDALLRGQPERACQLITDTCLMLRRLQPQPSMAKKMLLRFLRQMQSIGAHVAVVLPQTALDHLNASESALLELVRTMPAEHGRQQYGDRAMDELIRSMLLDLAHPITLDEAAKRVGFSRTHFCRIFRKVTGESFNEFLTHKRIDHVCVLLKEPGAQLSTIAQSVGISDVRYFKKLFAQHMHMSVQEWIARQREDMA